MSHAISPDSTSYDELPYPSNPFTRTHPCNLASIAFLFGMTPAPPGNCRVLELGCASGGNLIPMAQDLPGAEFVGIDASTRQIAEGLAVIRELGITNIKLSHADILAFEPDGRPFDYIICHGVYSWVTRPVQDRILELARRHLSDQGVAYISYNTLPGWYLRAVVRDMMRYHASMFEVPSDRIQQSRALLQFLTESAATTQESYRHLLRDEAQLVAKSSDSYLYHEHLEEVNAPCYFHDFVSRAEKASLQFLGESCLSSMLIANFGEKVEKLLQGAPLLRQEQYMDFLRNRTFRETLLCHGKLRLKRDVAAESLAALHLRFEERLVPGNWDPTLPGEVSMPFGSGMLTVSAPITKAGILILTRHWPAFVQGEALFHEAVQLIGRSVSALAEADRAALRLRLFRDLMALFAKNLLAARFDPPSFVIAPAEHPVATALARHQARQGTLVTTRTHMQANLPALCRVVLPFLDGRHDRAALRQHVSDAVHRGELRVTRGEKPVSAPDEATLDAVVQSALTTIAESCLLVA